MASLNKKTKLLLTILGTIAVLFLALFLFLKSPLFSVKLTQKEIHIEAGQKADTNPHTYLEGPDWSVALSYVDTSAVKYRKVGRYPVSIYHGLLKYTAYVNIIDTTPPVVNSSVKNKTLIPGAIISAKSLGLDIKDYSEIESILFTKITSTKFYTGLPDEQTEVIRKAYEKGIPMEAEDFQFSFGGIYTLTISVQDAFYNTTETELTLTVEEPPIIEVAKDFYIVGKEQIDFSKYIKVWDFISGDMDVKKVEIDSSNVNLSNAGNYPITFTITDDYGLTTTKTATVHVTSQDSLQELINTHMIDRSTSTIIGAKCPYDSGYYTNRNKEFIQNVMLPTLVSIQNSAIGVTGKGFLIEINDTFATIATTQQIIKNTLEVDVTFFDDTTCSGAVVSASPERNMAFIRIPIHDMDKNSSSALCSDYVKNLRTVHINKGHWEKHKNNNQTITFPDSAAGTPLFDTEGRLVGMLQNETQTIPLDEILNYFEIVFKYKIQYQ